MSDIDQTMEASSLKPKKDSFSHWKGNKYPQVKLRGFYSDIASVDNVEKTGIIDQVPDVIHSHAWEVHKEKHVPLVHENINPIDPEKFSQLLKNQIHGATTEIIKITDFTLEGYLPKCFIPFYTAPGSLPRKVQIDRLKRLYLSMDISELLAKKNLQPDKLMPVHRPADEVILLNKIGQDPAPFPSFLPLHYFDNEDYEIWTAVEWLNKGRDNNVIKPLPGRALLPDVPSNLYNDPKDPKLVYQWFDVGVIDYDEKKKCWLVQKLSEDERVLDQNGKPIVNKGLKEKNSRIQLSNQYWVPRIQLQFLAEDPRVFANRVEAAFNERKKTEAYLRYQFYIDSMPNDGVLDLDQMSFRRMLNWTENPGLKTLPEKNKEDSVISLEKEINVDFKRTINKITFDKIITSHLDAFKFVSIPPSDEKPTPSKG
ncbi:Dynein heavy chain axonemal, partial [Brachionus plicatilis]